MGKRTSFLIEEDDDDGKEDASAPGAPMDNSQGGDPHDTQLCTDCNHHSAGTPGCHVGAHTDYLAGLKKKYVRRETMKMLAEYFLIGLLVGAVAAIVWRIRAYVTRPRKYNEHGELVDDGDGAGAYVI